MRILILSFYFEPDLSAGSFRTSALVPALQRVVKPGDQIDLLTTQPNRYASFVQDAPKEERLGQVTVRRFSLPAHRNGFADQVFSFASYARQVMKATRSAEYDVVIATSSRLFTASLGALVAKRTGAKLYLDIRDIFVDTMQDVLSPLAAWFVLPLLRQVEKWTVTRADHVNLVSAGFLDYFQHRYPTVHYSITENGIDDVFIGVNFEKQEISPKKIVLYAGNIGEGQGLSKIVPGLAKALADSHEFWIVGDGGQRADLAAAVANLSNVKLMLPVSRSELLQLYRKSDILFLHLNDYPAFRKVLPSKLFEYAVTGKPMVAGVAGHAAEFLMQVPGVAVFSPCNVDDGARALRMLDTRPAGRQEFLAKYRRGQLMQTMAESILRVASNAQGRV